jgi:sulfoxide reductase heme-binding subunit YedZ
MQARTARPRTRSLTQSRWVPWVVIVLALLPGGWGVFAIVSDFTRDTMHLGANPTKALEHFYGDWTLRFLVATLLITPVRRATKWNWLQRYRRRLGLIAFTYACLHLLTYALADVQLNWGTLAKDLTKRWYIIIGMTAFLLLLSLAITSTSGSVRRLGKRWVQLHRVIYVAVVLGTMHYWMSVKRDIRDPALYAVIFAALLAYRVWHSLLSPSPRPASSASPPPNSSSSA